MSEETGRETEQTAPEEETAEPAEPAGELVEEKAEPEAQAPDEEAEADEDQSVQQEAEAAEPSEAAEAAEAAEPAAPAAPAVAAESEDQPELDADDELPQDTPEDDSEEEPDSDEDQVLPQESSAEDPDEDQEDPVLPEPSAPVLEQDEEQAPEPDEDQPTELTPPAPQPYQPPPATAIPFTEKFSGVSRRLLIAIGAICIALVLGMVGDFLLHRYDTGGPTQITGDQLQNLKLDGVWIGPNGAEITIAGTAGNRTFTFSNMPPLMFVISNGNWPATDNYGTWSLGPMQNSQWSETGLVLNGLPDNGSKAVPQLMLLPIGSSSSPELACYLPLNPGICVFKRL